MMLIVSLYVASNSFIIKSFYHQLLSTICRVQKKNFMLMKMEQMDTSMAIGKLHQFLQVPIMYDVPKNCALFVWRSCSSNCLDLYTITLDRLQLRA